MVRLTDIFFMILKFDSDSMLQKQVKDITYITTPVQENLEKCPFQNEFVEHLFELHAEDMIVVIQQSQYFYQQDWVIRFQDTSDSCVEIAKIELLGDLFVGFWQYFEIMSDDLEGLHYIINFVEMGFLEQKLNENIKQFLVLHQLNWALHEMWAILDDLVGIHFS